mmetsp:Transcript_18042/g.25433  ORF Transcript_18042/g.25433 Transcript_18042/m.25433 type:complete len:356 (-) Transcript_18042:774-1841(-)
MISDLVRGCKVKATRLMYVVPKEKGKQSWYKSLSPKKKALVCFACPVTFNIPQDDSGEYKGYEIDIPEKWVQDYGPTILMALKITQVALAAGRLAGLPLPNLEKAGEAIKSFTKSSHLVDVKEFMEELVKNKQVQELIQSNYILSIGNDVLSGEKTMAEGLKETVDVSPSPITNQLIEKSMTEVKKIAEDYKDEDFQKSELKFIEADDGCTEYVHPYIAPFFIRHGKKCFEMPSERIQEIYWEAWKAHMTEQMTEQMKGPQVVWSKSIEWGAWGACTWARKSRFGVLLEDRSLQCYQDKLSFDDSTGPEKIVYIESLSWKSGTEVRLSRKKGNDKKNVFKKEEDAEEFRKAWSKM